MEKVRPFFARLSIGLLLVRHERVQALRLGVTNPLTANEDMKTTTKILFGACIAITTLVLCTFLLPRHIHDEQSATLGAPPAAIYALGNSNRG